MKWSFLFGCDGCCYEVASELNPGLTTIAVPTVGMGEEAARILIQRMRSETPATRTLDLGFQLVARRSACGSSQRDGLDQPDYEERLDVSNGGVWLGATAIPRDLAFTARHQVSQAYVAPVSFVDAPLAGCLKSSRDASVEGPLRSGCRH